MKLKKLQSGIYLNTETGVITYSSVCLACDNYQKRIHYKHEYGTTVCGTPQFGADIE